MYDASQAIRRVSFEKVSHISIFNRFLAEAVFQSCSSYRISPVAASVLDKVFATD